MNVLANESFFKNLCSTLGVLSRYTHVSRYTHEREKKCQLFFVVVDLNKIKHTADTWWWWYMQFMWYRWKNDTSKVFVIFFTTCKLIDFFNQPLKDLIWWLCLWFQISFVSSQLAIWISPCIHSFRELLLFS